MLHRGFQIGFFAVLVSFVASCAPDPTEVCKHAIKVMANDPDRPGWLDDEEKCHERMEGTKTRHGVNSYRREVECLLGVDTSYKIRTCLENEDKRRR